MHVWNRGPGEWIVTRPRCVTENRFSIKTLHVDSLTGLACGMHAPMTGERQRDVDVTR